MSVTINTPATGTGYSSSTVAAFINGGEPITVTAFADLPDAADNNNKLAWVLTTTGALWTKKYSGWYISNGVAWVPADVPSSMASNVEVDSTDILYSTADDLQTALEELSNAFDPTGTALGQVAAHEAAPDPHTQYALEANLGALATLDEVDLGTDVTGTLPGLNQQAPDFQYFSTSDTWAKPAGAKCVLVICIGAGGGGGSGRQANSLGRAGGGGGGAGIHTRALFDAAMLGDNETVTVGAGGPGGPAQSTNDTNGTAGTAGGLSCFGGTTITDCKIGAVGGAGGIAGTGSASAVSGATFTFSNQYFPCVGTASTLGTGSGGTRGAFGPTGGAGGGGINSGGTQSIGGTPVAYNCPAFTNGFPAGPSGGAIGTNGTAGTNGVTDGSSTEIFGGGGSGGGSSTSGNGGDGGDGGSPGGGGGGSGASVNGFASGKGGDGGDGAVIVISYF